MSYKDITGEIAEKNREMQAQALLNEFDDYMGRLMHEESPDVVSEHILMYIEEFARRGLTIPEGKKQ